MATIEDENLREDHELLSSNQKRALARNYDKLGSNMKIENLLPRLIKENVIRIEDKISIMSQKTPQQQKEMLIDHYINTGSKGTFRKFVECLVQDGQLPIAILLDPNAWKLVAATSQVQDRRLEKAVEETTRTRQGDERPIQDVTPRPRTIVLETRSGSPDTRPHSSNSSASSSAPASTSVLHLTRIFENAVDETIKTRQGEEGPRTNVLGTTSGSSDTRPHPCNTSASSSAPASTSVLHLTGLDGELIDMDVLQGEQKMVKRNVTKLPPGVHIYIGSAKVQVDECYYYFGGWSRDEQGNVIAHNNAYKYNRKSKQWITLNSLPDARRSAAACNIGNVIIIVGGCDEDDEVVASVWAYNMSDDSYTALNDMPAGLIAPAAAVYEGIAYVSGGHGGNRTNTTSKVIYQYNKEKDAWKQVGSLLHARCSHGMFEYDGSLYNIGGVRGTDQIPVLSIERFDPHSAQSTLLSSKLPYKMLQTGWVRHGRYVYFAVVRTNYLYCFDITSEKIMQCGEEEAVFEYLMLA